MRIIAKSICAKMVVLALMDWIILIVSVLQAFLDLFAKFVSKNSQWWNHKLNFSFLKFFFSEADPCDGNPCQNGGACDSRGGEFFCICNGFTGRLCENPETSDNNNNNEPSPGQRQPSNQNQSPNDENDTLVILETAQNSDQQNEKQNRVGLYLAITGASFACVAGAVGVGTFIHKV